MKIKEFIRIAKENDYEYEYDESCFRTRFKREVEGCTNKISINEWAENRMWIYNDKFCDEKDFNMIKATMKYAETPLGDREEEKKFYLRHRWIVNSAAGEGYLNWLLHADIMILSSTLQDSSAKTQFTLKEIEEIKEKFDTDLNDFELVEVVE